MGGLLEASGRVLEASWPVWVPSWASWSDLSSALSPFQSSGRPPEAALACFGTLVGERSVPEADATIPESARPRPEAPRSARESGGVGPKETTILDLSGLHEPWGTPLRAKGTVADIQLPCGKSRHRASQACSVASVREGVGGILDVRWDPYSGMPVGGLLEAVLRSLGGCLGAS